MTSREAFEKWWASPTDGWYLGRIASDDEKRYAEVVWQAGREALEAENARLREALEKLASVEGNGVARLALATKEQS